MKKHVRILSYRSFCWLVAASSLCLAIGFQPFLLTSVVAATFGSERELPVGGLGLSGVGAGATLAAEDNRVVFSAPYAASRAGSVYSTMFAGGAWSGPQQLPIASVAGDETGSSIAMSGNVAAIGAQYANGTGLVSLFTYDSATQTWSPLASSSLAPPATSARFGAAVAVAGDRIIIGAPGESEDIAGQTAVARGAAYIYARDATTGSWSLEQRMPLPSSLPLAGARFGSSIAFDGTTLVVGAPTRSTATALLVGSAYIFRRTGSGATPWQLEQALDAPVERRAAFGSSLGVSGDIVLVGAPLDDPLTGDRGGVYTYRYDPTQSSGGRWVWQPGALTIAGIPSGARFGATLLYRGNQLIVGAPAETIGTIVQAGAVYAFDALGTGWSAPDRLQAATPATQAAYGTSLGLGEIGLIVGAPGTSASAGHIYAYPYGQAPVITSAPITAGLVGAAYSYDVQATGNPAPTFVLDQAPMGMMIDAVTGVISWTPDTAGGVTVTIRATNGINPDAIQTLTIDVRQPTTATATDTATATATDTATVTTTTTATATGIPTTTATATGIPTSTAIAGSIRPLVSCVAQLSSTTYLALFGYENASGAPQSIAVGSNNRFDRYTAFLGQDESFQVGTFSRVFGVVFDGAPLTWQLAGATATADSASPSCSGFTYSGISPIVECIAINSRGGYTANFGYLNSNAITIAIPVSAPLNYFNPGPTDRRQPSVFRPGRHTFVFAIDFNGSALVWTLNGRTSTASASGPGC